MENQNTTNRPMLNKMLHKYLDTVIYVQSHYKTLLLPNECAAKSVRFHWRRIMIQGSIVKASDILNKSCLITSTRVCSIFGWNQFDSIPLYFIRSPLPILTSQPSYTPHTKKYCTIDNPLFHIISNSIIIILRERNSNPNNTCPSIISDSRCSCSNQLPHNFIRLLSDNPK